MSATGVREWLVPGAAVASVTDRSGSRRLARSTVARIGKRDVVLTNGERFNVHTLTRREGGDWGWTVDLVPADDPRVVATEAAIREANLRGRALAAVDDWRIGAGKGSDPLPVIKALAALLPDDQCARVLAAL